MCGCGSTVPQVSTGGATNVSVQQIIDVSTNNSSSSCALTLQNLQNWQIRLNKIPNEERVNYNIYMGYIKSGINENSLICGALFPMLKTIEDYINSLPVLPQ